MRKTQAAEKSVQKSSRELTHVAENENGLGQPTTLHPLLRLQQTIGNQAVQRLLKSSVLQAELKINVPGDQYEQEADRLSEEVMNSSDGVATGISDGPPNIQKKCAACASGKRTCLKCAEEEEEVVQRKALASTVTPMIQRQEKEPAARTETPSPGLIVEGNAGDVRPGQMRKSEFLSQLRTAMCSTAEDALSGTIWSAMGCPYIDRWFNHYAKQDSQHVERAIRKYAPETASVKTAREYIPIVTQRVRRGIEQWAKTGEMTGVPEEFVKGGMPGATAAGLMGGLVSGALSAVGSVVSSLVRGAGRAISGIGRMLFKGREGGAREAEEPEAIHGQLGSGYALEGSVKSRMESALGVDFSGVRIHTNAKAQELNTNLNARAFTIGSDIAFGSGEYQPGTLIGDALIAHELAHVVQQGGGSSSVPMQKGDAAYNSLEEDADVSAVGTVVSVWGGVKGALAGIGKNAMPRLRSGLRLQRCEEKKAEEKKVAKKEPKQEKCPSAGDFDYGTCKPPRVLDFNDFLPVDDGSLDPFDAQVSSTIDMMVGPDGNRVYQARLRAENTQMEESSQTNQDKVLLRHERLHWAITCFLAHLGNKAVAQGEAYGNVDEVLRSIHKELQEEYDMGTWFATSLVKVKAQEGWDNSWCKIIENRFHNKLSELKGEL